ncbi:hypothetical protein C6990_03700 [Nitrosopumilus sp. b3]|uniref:hypothetical protein n=1 Tax=Nitrosopumilus sp. b3 TaxID=2109909 RepID=UPI0015F5F7E7|nr:hypothetical protein [Nitrosopumilus sp. b3]KAF6247565.1 hypothetical protein C6990_03700 [Nitrosopumilus sp. b3]
MALTISLILTGIAIGLLVLYAADVAVAMSSDSDHGFLPLDHMQRGMGLGGPALILPIIAFFISRKEPSKGLGVMIIISGILIVIGGIVVLVNPAPAAESSDRDPISSMVMMFIPAAIQLALGAIKISKS